MVWEHVGFGSVEELTQRISHLSEAPIYVGI